MRPAEEDAEDLAAEIPDSARREMLTRIDAYGDTAPRATARAEEFGQLVLFVAERGWPYYARPRLDRSREPTPDDIREVLARQDDLGVPQALEWVHEQAPSLTDAARAAGLNVQQCPLLVLGSLVEPRPPDGDVRLMNADDVELADTQAAIRVAFGTPGTEVAESGVADRDEAAVSVDAIDRLELTVEALRMGHTVRVGAFVSEAGAVGGGSHNPRGEVSELVGVGVLPAFRRRGLAGAMAHLLARQALEIGVSTVFCGAESTDVARVYERVGFRRVGTTCVAAID